MSHTLAQINQMSNDEFVSALGGVYEHSPWVAVAAARLRPYATFEQLYAGLRDTVAAASADERLALIRAHPVLLGKQASLTGLSTASRDEQASVGLDHCSENELAQLATLNLAYREKFGFPFVIAVRGRTREQIIASMRQRLRGTHQAEFDACLAEIDRIAYLRLQALVTA